MNQVALEALHEAANAIRLVSGIRQCTVETDRNGGEIIFDCVAEKGSGIYYMLKLECIEPGNPLWEDNASPLWRDGEEITE
jgi:hypothetical protein